MLIFRKRLMLDTDPQELARVKQVLDKNNIAYEVKTSVADNALARSFNVAASMRTKTSYSVMDTQSFVYQLYVSPTKYSEARKLCYGK